MKLGNWFWGQSNREGVGEPIRCTLGPSVLYGNRYRNEEDVLKVMVEGTLITLSKRWAVEVL
jgi:hypothetical protein